jgi:hypothetical protein
MSYSQQPLPREYRVTGTKPVTAQPVQPLPQPKKAGAEAAGLPFLTASQSFMLLLALHGIIIAGEVYLAWKSNWI